MATRMKQKAISIVDRIFPEYSDLFEDTFGTTSKAILSRATTLEEIAAIPTDELVEMVKKASRGRYGREYAVKVKSTATDTVGT